MSVASWSGSLLAWEQELAALKARVGRVLRRRELRETGAAFLDGLLSGIERKTGWLMAEQSGAERPYCQSAPNNDPRSASKRDPFSGLSW